MARIRTVKPDFFRHELLQDLQASHPGLHPMLVFIGLWTQCDKNGVFEYKPRQLKLDILPFLEYDISSSIALLIGAGLVRLMIFGEATGKQRGSTGEATGVKIYGFVPTFNNHQRINGKEKQDPAKFPQPTEMTEYVPEGSNGEASGKHLGSNRDDGKGREGKGTLATTTNVAETFERKRNWLSAKFPNADLDFQKEKLLTKYPDNVADPWLLILNWFELVGKGGRDGRSGTSDGAKGARAEKGGASCGAVDATEKPPGYFAGDFPDRSDEW